MKIKKFYTKHEKLLLTIFFAIFFLFGYFSINHLTSFRETHFLNLTIDDKLPLIPAFIIFYLSSFIFVFIPFFIIKEKKLYKKVIHSYLLIMIICYIVFLIYPVEIQRPIIDSNGIFINLLNQFYKIDNPYNNFPSLHVALSFIAGMACCYYKRKYWWILIWSILISISTLLVKQHYILDVLTGGILAIICYLIIIKEKIKSK